MWEKVWLHCDVNSREKRFMQALIQLANAKLKSMQGNVRSAVKIQRIAVELINEAYSGFHDESDRSLMGLKHLELLELSQNNAL